MVPHKFARAAPAAVLEELVGREQAFLDRLWVELHLVARDRVDERADHFEERVDQEGDVQDQRRAQAFYVVRLKYIHDLDEKSVRTRNTSNEDLLTVFAVVNDGFFALSAKLIINTTDLIDNDTSR